MKFKSQNPTLRAMILLTAVVAVSSVYARPVPRSRKGASPQTFLRQENTVSNVEFSYTNRGVLFNAGVGQQEGLFWPRGSGESYIFGEGLWFVTRKRLSQDAAEVKDGWSLAGSVIGGFISGFVANSSTKCLVVASNGTSLLVRQDTDEGFKSIITFNSPVNALGQLSNGKLLIGIRQGLFVGTEAGPWNPTSITTSVSAISSNGVVFAGLTPSRDSIYTSDSNGLNWTPRSKIEGIRNLSSILNNSMILASSPQMLLFSEDTGKAWDTIPLPALISGAALASDGSILIATSAGVLQSSDRGANWDSRNAGLNDSNIRFIRSDDGRNFVLATDSGVFTNIATNGNFGSWKLITHGEPWRGSVFAAVIDSSKACHIVDSAGDIYTQWKSRTLVPGIKPLCDVGYNPNSGSGCYTEGEASQFGLALGTDGADPNAKYISYVSPRYDRTIGNYIPGSSTVVPSPYYSWPVWDTSSANRFEHNYYFGDYISDVRMRNAASLESANPELAMIGKTPLPAIVSQEDIVNLYSDVDTANNPLFVSGTGYPFGIDVQEIVYSWGYGRYRDMIFVRYKVKNSSNDTLFDSWIAPAFDPDLGFAAEEGYLNDANSYVDSSVVAANADSADVAQLREPYRSNPGLLNMAYQYNDPFKNLPNGQQYGMVGFSFVESTVIDSLGNIIANGDSSALHGYGPNSLFQKNQQGLATLRDWTIANDPPNGPLQYAFVSTGEHDTFNGVYGDQRLMMATGPFNLAPGKSAEATFVVTFAHVSDTSYKENFGELLLLTDFAHQVFGEVDSTQSGGTTTGYFVNHFQVTPQSSVKGSEAGSGLTIDKPFPNPFTTDCSIAYQNSVAGEASAIVTDILGRTAQSFSLGEVSAGEHTLTIGGADLPAGAYRVTVVVGSEVASRMVAHIMR